MVFLLVLELISVDLAKRIAAQMMERLIIINRTIETVLRFLPPYILERKHVEAAISALHELLKANTEYAGTAPAGEQLHG
jgi:acetylornithine aminotransferase/acetylornithine/N-succinyldiaminopimelate aminotransferase